MEVRALAIPDVKLLTPRIHRDSRGFFSETYRRKDLVAAGITADLVQDNQSLSVETGVVRGLHFQIPPHEQGKLVRVVRGSILDVAVDLRRGSPTFGRHVSATLSAQNWTQIWVPPGFAHGFCTLEPNTEVIYKVTSYYEPTFERGIRWNDPDLVIDWPVEPQNAILSPKDAALPLFAALPGYF